MPRSDRAPAKAGRTQGTNLVAVDATKWSQSRGEVNQEARITELLQKDELFRNEERGQERSAGFPTCRIADFQVGQAIEAPEPVAFLALAGWENCDTADWEAQCR
jgi:hypothetical protein